MTAAGKPNDCPVGRENKARIGSLETIISVAQRDLNIRINEVRDWVKSIDNRMWAMLFFLLGNSIGICVVLFKLYAAKG